MSGYADALAKVVTDTHVLEGNDYHRAHTIAPLIFAYGMMQDLGWAEHTSDWDWEVRVYLKDGTTIESVWDQGDDDLHFDVLELPFGPQEMPFALDKDYDYGGIIVTVSGTVDRKIRLDTIASIYIGEL